MSFGLSATRYANMVDEKKRQRTEAFACPRRRRGGRSDRSGDQGAEKPRHLSGAGSALAESSHWIKIQTTNCIMQKISDFTFCPWHLSGARLPGQRRPSAAARLPEMLALFLLQFLGEIPQIVSLGGRDVIVGALQNVLHGVGDNLIMFGAFILCA